MNSIFKSIIIILLSCFSFSVLNAQNNPCSASPLTVNSSCSFSTYTNVGTGNSGEASPGCGSYTTSGNDVWFIVTVPSNGNLIIDTDDAGLDDAAMAIYNGTCGSLSLLECDDDDSQNGNMPYLFQTGLTPGSSVWVRVWDYGGNQTGTFRICASGYSYSEQDCPGGTTVCSDDVFAGNSSGSGDFQELNASNRGCLSDDENESSWYFFSPQTSGVLEFEIDPGGTAIDYDFAIWGPYGSAVCPPTGSPIRCSYSGAGGVTGLQSGAGDNSEGPGGDGVVNPLNVTAGQVYVMLIDNYSVNGTPFDFNWDLSGGATLDCIVLNIELVSLKVENKDGNALVKWATATEENSDYFILEKAGKNGEFEHLSYIKSIGSSNSLTNYSYLDRNVLPGISYYKLHEVDLQGKISTFQIVSYNNVINHQFSIAPNPFSDEITLNTVNVDQEYLNLIITDISGKIVHSESLEIANGTTKIDLSIFVKGLYIFQLFNDSGEEVYSDKIIRQ